MRTCRDPNFYLIPWDPILGQPDHQGGQDVFVRDRAGFIIDRDGYGFNVFKAVNIKIQRMVQGVQDRLGRVGNRFNLVRQDQIAQTTFNINRLVGFSIRKQELSHFESNKSALFFHW